MVVNLESNKTTEKYFASGFYWATLFNDAQVFVSPCDKRKWSGNISFRNEMLLNNYIEVELFDVWGLTLWFRFHLHLYICMVVDYVSTWVEAVTWPTKGSKVVVNFWRKHIITSFGTPRLLFMIEELIFAIASFKPFKQSMEFQTRLLLPIILKLVAKCKY